MVDLKKARKIARFVRIPEDKPSKNFNFSDLESRDDVKDTMLRHGVLISKSVTPSLEDQLNSVCETLHIPRECVSAFVYNNPEVQADCVIDSPNTCVLRFTSGLINLMAENELKFVIGHELGHFLFGHGSPSEYLSAESSENFMVKRARELSSDRLGYLSTGNQQDSLKAIIKTASGLSDQFLRFDVTNFMSQKNLISNPSKGELKNSTHPSMLIRCRSLLWFAMSVHSFGDLNGQKQEEIDKINSQVVKDLEKFVDGRVRLRKSEFEKDIALWKSVLLIYHSGTFTKQVQKRIHDTMGEDTLHSIKSFFELYAKEELLDEITRRLDEKLNTASQEFPSSAKKIENAGYTVAYKVVEG